MLKYPQPEGVCLELMERRCVLGLLPVSALMKKLLNVVRDRILEICEAAVDVLLDRVLQSEGYHR